MAFRLRDLFNRYPFLDRIRRGFLVGVATKGNQFFTDTYRVEKVFHPEAHSLIKSGQPVLYAIFHGRMVGLMGMKDRSKLTILISNSRDGEMIARAVQSMGFCTARGSPANGGVHGALELVTAAEQGNSLVFTVDGPRGPAFEVKEGVIRIAELTSLPIVPFVCDTRTNWWMSSWDQFLAPFWGTPIVYAFGKPITVQKNSDAKQREVYCKQLEARMNHMRLNIDKVFARCHKRKFPHL